MLFGVGSFADDLGQMGSAGAPNLIELEFPAGCQKLHAGGGIEDVTVGDSLAPKCVQSQRARKNTRSIGHASRSLVLEHGCCIQ
jgi:hypothetical protein